PLSPPLPWRQPLSPPLPSRPPPSRLPPSLRLREPPIPLPPPLLLRFPSPPSPSGVPHAPRHTSPAWLMPRSLPQRARLQPSTARPCARPLRRGAPDPARATSPLRFPPPVRALRPWRACVFLLPRGCAPAALRRPLAPPYSLRRREGSAARAPRWDR